MKQLERLLFLIKVLKAMPFTSHELLAQLSEQNNKSSIRQLQRDFKDMALLLSNNETLKSYRKDKLKYFFIEISESHFTNANESKTYKNTNFYVQSKPKQINFNLNAIENAIKESKSIVISEIKNDETGDNNNFETKNIFFQPIQILIHRDSYYVGGYNIVKKCIQIFGINQIEKVALSNQFELLVETSKMFDDELNKRFGVTKNINEHTYKIVLEVSSVLSEFIKNHHWHASQRFSKKNGNTLMHLECGINRELLGWLFQWMYNIRVVEPEILKFYYEKTLNDIQNNNNSKATLVYRNLFNNTKN
ncbi:WYL domain-containing protein [Flavobacterium sp.]|jgi:predicted DNA-binding transcriptional regulator YafY|uniref:WYL domain-containing protein n=1 Tax=Flavobacterium sp. TaxID=239 RepID=UPI0037C10030